MITKGIHGPNEMTKLTCIGSTGLLGLGCKNNNSNNNYDNKKNKIS